MWSFFSLPCLISTGQTASILPTNLTVIEGDDATFACSPFVSSSLPVLQIRPDSGDMFENIDESDPRLTIVMDFEAPNDPTNRTYRYSNLQRGEDMTQFTCSVNGNEAMPPVTIRVYCKLTTECMHWVHPSRMWGGVQL